MGCRDDMACARMTVVGDGGMSRATARCNTTAHRCVECIASEHCPIGQLCAGNVCVMGCDTARGCPTGQSCCGGGCVDTQNSPVNCGACGAVCTTANGVPACVAGRCGVGRCTDPFGDCDRDPATGCETNLQGSAGHCGQCGRQCAPPVNGTANCAMARCGIATCLPGFADCDADPATGCEVNTNTSLAHCGACARLCTVTGGAAACVNGQCQRSACDTGRGDCDGNTGNGCEADLTADPMNCRACGAACNAPNATPACVASVCTVGRCNTGFGNCDANVANGCETPTDTSVAHCGACGMSCAFARGTAGCTGGMCSIARCDMGFGNCDGNTANGCETDTNNTATHCGMCGNACPTPTRGRANCATGVCGVTCDAGFGNCDNNATNGCETATTTSLAHCGACGQSCVLANATGVCTAGMCRVSVCAAGFLDCDGLPLNGCEVDGRTDANNCGQCRRTCVQPNTNSFCAAGQCQVTGCTGSFANCDGNGANGCETDLFGSAAHCGACNSTCPAGRTCQVGRCAVASFAGYTVNTAPPATVAFFDACSAPGAVSVLASVDDQLFAGPLPFPVEFWGATNRDFVVSSNGQVGFGTLFYGLQVIPSQGTFRSFGALPLTPDRGMYPAAYVFGVDLVTSFQGVCIATTGTAPARRWTAETFSASVFGQSSTQFTFEVQINENSPHIDMLYGNPFFTPLPVTISSPQLVTIGVQDFRTPIRAAQYSGTVMVGTRIRFSPM